MKNLRYEKLNNLLKTWYKDKSQDENLLRSLYAYCNLEEHELVDRSENLKKGTNYTQLSTKDFVEMFEAEKFSSLDKDELKHLFQELHNRYMAGKGYEVTRNVAVVSDSSQSAYGYVNTCDDLMFINKYAIDKAKNEDTKNNFNGTNIGYSLLYILSHESQHVAQFESTIDYALNKKQDDETAFTACLMEIERANMACDDANGEITFLFNWKTNYDYQFIEHNANFSAFKTAQNMIPKDKQKGKSFDQYNAFVTLLALRDNPSLVKDPTEFIEKRIKKMEEFTRFEIDYFNEKITDCPLKTKMLETVNSFMEVDENGNSKFRDKLKKEILEMVEVSKASRKNLFDERKKSKTKNENKEALTLTL